MSQRVYTILISLAALCQHVLLNPSEHGKANDATTDLHIGDDRQSRILNLFSVVRFPNGVCRGNSGQNGTCYATDECESKGGSTDGSCASGYGQCCIFSIGCGGQSSENCTYFSSTGNEVGQCRVKICPCSDNICQLRLDFDSFVLNGPSTSTTPATVINANIPVATATQCLTDQFTVTSPGFNPPPTICGQNTGDHMYVDASDLCNELGFNLLEGTSTVTRSWSIKVTQYDCSYNNLAPKGCTQYHFGSTSGLVQTYNWDGGQHLADQDQNICVRRERNNCRICWTTQAEGDFETSNAMTGATGKAFMNAMCCGYGAAANAQVTGYDCAMIPSASKQADAAALDSGAANGFCGGELGDTAMSIAAATICSRKVPFNIRFLSDRYENTDAADATKQEAAAQPNGFRLIYTQTSC